MGSATGIDVERVQVLKEGEDARFVSERPRSAALLRRGRESMPNGMPMAWLANSFDHPLFASEGRGAHFTDVDGHDYADFNIADMSMFCGYAPEPLVAAVTRRMSQGHQFMLPTEDAGWVAEELARRWGLPLWQFTLSASQANAEVIRLARVATGREKVLLFEGKYHGHLDATLVALEGGRVQPEERGLPGDVVRQATVVPFNDLAAVEAALEPGDVAVILAEPAMTNNHGLILPDPGFHAGLRDAARRRGAVLALDETHTLVCGPGGLTRAWGLEPDMVSVGKSIAGGVPLGAYGMTEDLGRLLEDFTPLGDGGHATIATGGTLFGNALSMAAARAALSEILTDEAYAHTAELGTRLADGIQAALGDAGLDWKVHRLFPRSGVTFGPTLPRDATQAGVWEDRPLSHLIRVWLANRGVWEAIVGAGPTVPVPATAADVDAYVEGFGALVAELVR